jgi:hypothetical protein
LRDVKEYVAVHSREEAEQEWETVQEHFEQVRRFYNMLDEAREVIKADLLKWRVRVLVAILTLIVVAIGVLLRQLQVL